MLSKIYNNFYIYRSCKVSLNVMERRPRDPVPVPSIVDT